MDTSKCDYPFFSKRLYSVLLITFLFFTAVLTPEPVDAAGGEIRTSEVDIDDKTDKYNAIFVGERRFRVSPTAAILDINKKEIPLSLVPIPCRAKIEYFLFGDHREPLIKSIQLK